tara:strand:- start:192 stop:1280 length:1089 start_codon:yes stop_codon:yes gene_type:complete
MKRILFLALHRPGRSPSQRFRFEQYIGFLRESGFTCDFFYLITEKDDPVFYGKGNFASKFRILLKSIKQRWREVKLSNSYDLVYIQRECFMLGTSLFERLFARKSKMIFDFDDSIWLANISEGNQKFIFLKNSNKTKDIIRASNMVFAGNNYLATYARQFNSNVKVVPTTIDTDQYVRDYNPEGRICIGWSGSVSTIEHFEYAIPFLTKIKEKYGGQVIFKVIGDESYRNKELGIVGLPWRIEEEVKELSSFDIGIMPLPDDDWARGKCGLKGLQYMALETATVMSPVGVNSEIICSGENGFLADSVEDWVNKLSELIENESLRKNFGEEGRKTVMMKYSVKALSDKYVDYFHETINGKSYG